MMWSVKNYQLGFDPWGLALFLAVMLPNFLWFAFPAPNDILRRESVTPLIDAAAQGFQLAMAAALCVIISTARDRRGKRGYLVGTAVCVLLYFSGWAAYYAGITNAAVVLDLCLAPCAALLLFAFGRNHAIAFISAAVFTVCHFIFAVVNFIL